MSVENLTKYALQYYTDSFGNHKLTIDKSKHGNLVKREEAIEASSNSLKQLKTEIASLKKELSSHNSNYAKCPECGSSDIATPIVKKHCHGCGVYFE
jgi:hypothetical protein